MASEVEQIRNEIRISFGDNPVGCDGVILISVKMYNNVVNLIDRISAKDKTAVFIKPPKEKSLWKHNNGNTYEVICIANSAQHITPEKLGEYPPTVVYKNLATDVIYQIKLTRWYSSMSPTFPFAM